MTLDPTTRPLKKAFEGTMGVLQVVPALETGGVERTTLDIAASLIAHGHRAIIASAGGRMVAELEALGATHVTLPLASKNPLMILANGFRLARLAVAEGVTHIHARSRAPAWSALLAARRTGLPFITTYHGIYNQKGRIKSLYNSVMARGDAVIANSHYTARIIAERHPFAARRITVIHRGADIDALTPGAISEQRRAALRDNWGVGAETPLLLNIGRLTPWKGQGVVIDAMSLLASRFPDLVAILAGDDQGRTAYRDKLEAHITRLGLEGRVRLVGHVSDVAAALSLAQVATVASVEPEAFGRAAVEAQAMQVPVVVSDLGAVPETVLAPPEVSEAERTGWRVFPGDAAALADALGRAITLEAADRTALGTRARSHVETHFTKEVMASATLEIYRTLAS